jgi:hypothetical protein
VKTILTALRRHRTNPPRDPAALPPFVQDFRDRVAAFAHFVRRSPAEEGTAAYAEGFQKMAEGVAFAAADDDPTTLVKLVVSRPHAIS